MSREIKEGERFGRLTVLYKIPCTNHIKYHCLCDCGKYVDKDKYSLLNGHTKSCGCYRKELAHSKVAKNLVGQRFGKLTVIKRTGIYKQGQKWLCRCDCGNVTEVFTVYLTHGDTKSCGCLKREKMLKHGYGNTKLYNVYQAMKYRCFNEKAQEYHRYGGRGITVCEEWKKDFLAFRKWAIDNGYKENKGLTLDRINNDGNYEPTNCRWVNRGIQALNRGTTIMMTFNGKSKPQYKWCKELHTTPKRMNKLLAKGASIGNIATIRKYERQNKKYINDEDIERYLEMMKRDI